MPSNYKFSVLINTTDSFDDCWIPFFTLFKKYWPEYDGIIYLNTETKDFNFPGLNIVPIKNNPVSPSTKITWSECLVRAIDSIESEIILYMQEDYFLKDYVKDSIVSNYAQLMLDNPGMHCIHLTDQAVIPETKSDLFDGLYSVKSNQRYFVSCQAALWRKKNLKLYIKPYESAWEFEEFGSIRAGILKGNFYVVDKTWVKLNEFEIIPYIFTGIIQGRWYEEILPLFADNNIKVDYSKRGFVKDATRGSIKLRVKRKLKRLPTLFKHKLNLFFLKNQANRL